MAKYKNVLIIDDDQLTLFIMQRLIKNADFSEQITTFIDSQVALNYLEENITAGNVIPEIILLDINMPFLNGWDFMEKLNDMADGKTTMPAISIFSATIEKEDIEKSKNYPFLKNFLMKPLLKEHFNIL